MHLQDLSGLKSSLETEVGLFRSLLRIQNALSLTQDELREFLGAEAREFRSLLLTGGRGLTIRQLDSFCSRVDLSVETLVAGEVDVRALAAQYNGHLLAIPERYEEVTLRKAKLRAVKSTFELMSAYFGFTYARRALRRLQLHPAFLEQEPSLSVSGHMLCDLLEDMKLSGMRDEHFRSAGIFNLSVNRNTELDRLCRSATDPKSMYELVHDRVVPFYDQLFEYRLIRLGAEKAVMETRVRKETLDAAGARIFGSRETCLYKQGVYTSFLRYFEDDHGSLTETECMYTGGDRCVYHLTWSPRARLRSDPRLPLQAS